MNMRTSLLAAALVGAFAGSAAAADVSLYGLVDYGFQYESVDQGSEQYESDKFQMKSGMNSGSRFGLKGSEEIAAGTQVGFVCIFPVAECSKAGIPVTQLGIDVA